MNCYEGKCTYEFDTLMVVESLKKFRIYLVGKKFMMVTDCKALKTSTTKKDLLPRIARWWLQLQELTLKLPVEHRRKKMTSIDARGAPIL